MAAKCPHCGETLKWYNFRAECKNCGVNIPNYNWEARLEEDADAAETAFAKLHYRLKNFKSGTVGSVFRIVRLVLTLLPLVALVVPLLNLKLSMPFFEKEQSVSFLTFILDYLTKMDIGGAVKLMSGTALGTSVTYLMLAVIAALLAVVAGVLNFFVVLIAALKLKAGFNVVLNVISTACWTGSAVLLMMFVNSTADSTVNVFSGSVVWWGYAIGIALFAVNVVINIVTSIQFKKQLAAQPSLEQAIENELKELRENEANNKITV